MRSLVCSQVATHLRAGALTRAEAGLHVAGALDLLGVDSLTAYTDAHSGWRAHLLDAALRLNPVEADERCTSPVCHRISFLYGLLYEHHQLDERIHEGLHELFGLIDIGSLDHLAALVRAGHLVDATGGEAYLGDAQLTRLAVPTLLLGGAENRCWLPQGLDETAELLGRANGADLYERVSVAGYGHIDGIFGARAFRDVHPHIVEHLLAT